MSRFLSCTCTEVSGVENIGKCGRLSQLRWLLGELYLLTYLLTKLFHLLMTRTEKKKRLNCISATMRLNQFQRVTTCRHMLRSQCEKFLKWNRSDATRHLYSSIKSALFRRSSRVHSFNFFNLSMYS